MELHWVNKTNMVGVGYGYSTHQNRLHDACVDQGVIMDEESDIAIHITTPDCFKPLWGKINILYTMYECTDIPESWVEPLEGADLIIVPCVHNYYLFKRYTNKPIKVVWEGTDPKTYPFHQRTQPKCTPDDPFIFLWFGATNPRKGNEHAIAAWQYFNERNPELRDKTLLIMKTTQKHPKDVIIDIVNKGYGSDEVETHTMPVEAERIMKVGGNAIVDTRRLPNKIDEPFDGTPMSLQQLYNMCHCFLFPTRGEGFGLTLAEACSTGMPAIYTDWSGPVDFMVDGYTIKWEFDDVKTIAMNQNGSEKVTHRTQAASADVDHLTRRMEQVYYRYAEALKKGKKQSEHIQKYFTWEVSALSFIETLKEYLEERKAA